jgi:hypothetical protein
LRDTGVGRAQTADLACSHSAPTSTGHNYIVPIVLALCCSRYNFQCWCGLASVGEPRSRIADRPIPEARRPKWGSLVIRDRNWDVSSWSRGWRPWMRVSRRISESAESMFMRRILQLLTDNIDRIVTKEALFEKIHGRPSTSNTRSVDVTISRLRLKLKSTNAGAEIRSVRQRGYILSRTSGPVQP